MKQYKELYKKKLINKKPADELLNSLEVSIFKNIWIFVLRNFSVFSD